MNLQISSCPFCKNGGQFNEQDGMLACPNCKTKLTKENMKKALIKQLHSLLCEIMKSGANGGLMKLRGTLSEIAKKQQTQTKPENAVAQPSKISCHYCGILIPADAKLCPACGMKNEKESVKESASKTVPQNKTAPSKFCLYCEKNLPADADTCPACGSKKFVSSLTELEKAKKELARIQKESEDALQKDAMKELRASKIVNGVLQKYVGTAKSLVIPKNISAIAPNAFNACKSIETVVISESVKSIGDSAFALCTNLAKIELPSTLTDIGNSAFEGCTKLVYADLPKNLSRIGNLAFANCSALLNVTISNNLTSIGYQPFKGCNMLNFNEYKGAFYLGTKDNAYHTLISAIDTSIMFGEPHPNTRMIAGGAFVNCMSLISITLPSGLTYIAEKAFESCQKLIEVVNNTAFPIKAGAKSYGGVALYATKVHHGSQMVQKAGDFIAYEEDGEKYLIGYVGTSPDVTLPKTGYRITYSIGDYAFYGRNDITSITIPDNITEIGEHAFEGCVNLKKITLPFIGYSKADRHSGIGYLFGKPGASDASRFIPKSLTEIVVDGECVIPRHAFFGCSGVSSIYLKRTVKGAESGALADYKGKIMCDVKKPKFKLPEGWKPLWHDSDTKVMWNAEVKLAKLEKKLQKKNKK